MDTCGDPYPFQGCMREWQLRLFRTQYQSSMPSFSFLDGRLNYDGSCKWWYQPIVQRQLKRRMQCGMWTPKSYDRDMSKRYIDGEMRGGGQIKWDLTHSWPYESVKSFTAFESHILRMPNKSIGKNPFSAIMTK